MIYSGLFFGAIGIAAVVVLIALIAILFRVVVATNEVHIVQSAKKTVSYGKDTAAGNTYYKWPSWVPVIGINRIGLPTSVFDQRLDNYAAYDKGRVPFIIDIIAFFRVTDSNMAAQRVQSVPELLVQLKSILQGAIRTILASSEIEEILEGRSKFGEMFTKEVDHQLIEWGVQNVKTIELMDIRDTEGSHVIANIMAKKKSLIESQSRIEVAGNMQRAQIAEVDAAREVEMRKQDAAQQVGTRAADKEREVGISQEVAKQMIKEQARVTAEKHMAVIRVEQVQQAEIAKQQTVVTAEGQLQQTKLQAEGIQAQGAARAEAEKVMQLAPVQAQITLAQEIGGNAGYQSYLIAIRQVEANQVVGVEQAKALTAANIKVIANSSGIVDGVDGVMGMFTPKGGTQLGAMLDAFKNTDAGGAVVKAFTKAAE